MLTALEQPGRGLQNNAYNPGEEGGFACISPAGGLWQQKEESKHPSCHPRRKGKACCARAAGRVEAGSDKSQRQSMGNG